MRVLAAILIVSAMTAFGFSRSIPFRLEGRISGVSDSVFERLQVGYYEPIRGREDRFPLKFDGAGSFFIEGHARNTLPQCFSLVLDDRIVDRYCIAEKAFRKAKLLTLRNIFDTSQVSGELRDRKWVIRGLDFDASRFRLDPRATLFDRAYVRQGRSVDSSWAVFRVVDSSGSLDSITLYYPEGKYRKLGGRRVAHEAGRFSLDLRDIPKPKRGRNWLYLRLYSSRGWYKDFAISVWPPFSPAMDEF